MLESLLVLGQIPGTNLQLTFAELILAIYLPMLAYIWAKRDSIARMDRQYFKLVYLRRRASVDLAMMGVKPAVSTRRIIAALPRRTFQHPRWPLGQPTRRAF